MQHPICLMHTRMNNFLEEHCVLFRQALLKEQQLTGGLFLKKLPYN